jgi:hypothetical protein
VQRQYKKKKRRLDSAGSGLDPERAGVNVVRNLRFPSTWRTASPFKKIPLIVPR